MQKKLYFQNLDASRFFAFLLVFLAHCFVSEEVEIKNSSLFSSVYDWGKVGVLGLEYFFVLSSFLISVIILEEKKQSQSFNLRNFLIRRSLRVWPLYFLILFIGFSVVLVGNLNEVQISPLPSWPYLFLFAVNFYIIEYGTEFLFFIAFLWSISVEEQFYLIWSIFMKFIKLRFDYFCWYLIVISLIFRFIYLDNSANLYFNTVSAFGNFGIGGLLAYYFHNNSSIINRLTSLLKTRVVLIYLALIASIIFYHKLSEFSLFYLFSRLYFSTLFAFVIINQALGEHRPFNMGRFKRICK